MNSSKSHGPTSSSRTQHTYRKYCSPGLAESFLESQVIYNSWKEHCNLQVSIPTVIGHPQNSKTATRQCASPSRRVKRQKGVSSYSGGKSNDRGSESHDIESESHHQVSESRDQVEGSHAQNVDTRRSHSQQESTVSNRDTPGDSEHNHPHHTNTILSRPTQNTISASSSSTQYQSALPMMPHQSYSLNPPIHYSSHPLSTSSPSLPRDHSTLTLNVVAESEPSRLPLLEQPAKTSTLTSQT